MTFYNGNATDPNFSGIDSVKTALAGFWKSFKSIRHEEIAVFESSFVGGGGMVVHEALNHYETLDGRKVSLRAVAVMERNDEGLIEALRVYSDQSPLFQG